MNEPSIELHIACTSDLSELARVLCVRILDDEEHTRYCRFVFEKDKWTFAMAHALLRCVLSRRSGSGLSPDRWRFGRERFGRPFVLSPALGSQSFNLSHSGNVAAVGLCSAPCRIGVDIEEVIEAQTLRTTITNFCSTRELALLSSIENHAQFLNAYYRIWTLKESFLKATGLGIGEHLCEVECDFDPASVRSPPGMADGLSVSCWQLEEQQHVMAISVISPWPISVAPVIHRWTSQQFVDALDAPVVEIAVGWDEDDHGRFSSERAFGVAASKHAVRSCDQGDPHAET